MRATDSSMVDISTSAEVYPSRLLPAAKQASKIASRPLLFHSIFILFPCCISSHSRSRTLRLKCISDVGSQQNLAAVSKYGQVAQSVIKVVAVSQHLTESFVLFLPGLLLVLSAFSVDPLGEAMFGLGWQALVVFFCLKSVAYVVLGHHIEGERLAVEVFDEVQSRDSG